MVLLFTNNKMKEFDFSAYLHYPVFEPLQDENLFKQATVYNGIVCRNDNIDFDLDTLYMVSKR